MVKIQIILLGQARDEWMSWDDIGLEVKDDRHKLMWRYCADLSHAWTGLVSLQPGQAEPCHRHTTPELFYILQGEPIISLNGVRNRTKKWQCVTIPSNCPHAIDNDGDQEVVVLWTYVSLSDKVDRCSTIKFNAFIRYVSQKVNPDTNYNWVWLEDVMK